MKIQTKKKIPMKILMKSINSEDIYRKYIDNWDNINDKDKHRCMQINEFRVTVLCEAPKPLPDWKI